MSHAADEHLRAFAEIVLDRMADEPLFPLAERTAAGDVARQVINAVDDGPVEETRRRLLLRTLTHAVFALDDAIQASIDEAPAAAPSGLRIVR